MEFKSVQKSVQFSQTNNANIDKVFPLMCPVREADWLDGWEYKMIYSESGLVEKNCVFTTPSQGDTDTIWQVIEHDKEKHVVEFLRVTPNENIVRIHIKLYELSKKQTKTKITYQYTSLNQEQSDFIENELENTFKQSMLLWEKAINHYLATGEMLKLLSDD